MDSHVEDYAPALGTDTTSGSFQQLDYTEAQAAVANAGGAFERALGEVKGNTLKRFAWIDMWTPNVTRAVTDLETLQLFLTLADIDPAVIKLDRFRRI